MNLHAAGPHNSRMRAARRSPSPETNDGRADGPAYGPHSPAEIMVVTPPCKLLSIQPIWFCRASQSPATGVDVAVDQAGATVVPLASTTVVAPRYRDP